MGINPTPTNFKTFTFDGENSRAYGVYITGEGVFNAPERNVEMVDIPGRNGAFALDKGNFNNIEVTYPAGIFADTEADFAQAVSDLRNLLCSKVGYVRLEDDYNPNEYRLAIYKSGLDVDHDFLIAGEFELVFECKPQRYLKSGETAISVTSGNTITNPTRFEAQPLLAVNGYGAINIGDATINIINAVMGKVLLCNAGGQTINDPILRSVTLSLATNALNSGDTIGGDYGLTLQLSFYLPVPSGWTINENWSKQTSSTPPWVQGTTTIGGEQCPTATFNLQYAKGTTAALNGTCGWIRTLRSGENYRTQEMGATVTVSYDGDSTINITASQIPDSEYVLATVVFEWTDVYGYSTKSILGNPAYVDLEIGEAWNEDSGTPFSINNAVSFPAELPTLASGENSITYDNTITQLSIVPRWWVV